MQLHTSRFGTLAIETDDLLEFPSGLIGFEDCHQWVLLADPNNNAVGWLQSADRPDTALAVVSPRRFVDGYRVRVGKSDLTTLALDDKDRLYALCVANIHHGRVTMNLRAPLLVNLDRRLGCQVITRDDQPIQAEIVKPSSYLRKSA